MAKRRCISVDVFNNDVFLDFKNSTKVLYTYFILNADDDGFVINPKTVMRLCGANDNDLAVLIENNYIIPFDNCVLVIKHWNVHNKVQPTRHTPTIYQTEFQMLSLNQGKEYVLSTKCQQNDDKMSAQFNITKDNLNQDNISKDKLKEEKRSQGKGVQRENPKTQNASDDDEFRAMFS